MKKKLLAVAVAGALAAPGLALAQSSVTISGVFKVSLENLKIPGRVGVNTSETRLSDDSSRIIFNVVEDLGGGLQAIGQVDMRVNMEQGTLAASGNDHVGFRSKTMGRFFIGRQDLHYFNRESNLTDLAGSLRADSISLIAFTRDGTAIAGATRTPNVMHYTSPNWGGFTVVAAYSTGSNPASTATGQGDLASAIRKGSAWNINPNFASGNWQAGWSYWQSKSDVTGATLATGDQRSNRLYGSFRIAGFKLGLAWDKSRIKSQATGANLAERTAWSLPVSYTMGNNQFHFHYTRARDDRATAASDGGKMVALSYQYTLSKRTSVGLTYAKITNDAAAAYNFFTSASLGNSAGAGVAAGEDPRLFAGTIRHAF
jgi:predicted porin